MSLVEVLVNRGTREVALVIIMLLIASASGSAKPRYDLLLKGGHVIDPANHIDQVMDVAVEGDKIAAVQPDIPADEAGKVVDVTGLYVTPGLIDIHFHIGQGGAPLNWFSPSARAHLPPLGIPADMALATGTTTIVDAGSSGADTFLQEKEEVIDHSTVRVLAFLNIVANGMNGDLEQTVDQMDPLKCADTINKYRDVIVGVKTAHYWTFKPWDPEHTPWAATDQAEACGRAANVPVMFDFYPREGRTYEDLILKKMRPGDIHTHVFAQQFPIIMPDGKVNPALWEARKRGVIFDVGHGSASFWFRNAVPAFKQGFIPDSFSTDLHIGNYNTVSMNTIMSEFLSMGVPLEDVIRRSTVNPAREIHRTDLGTLSVGGVADIAVLDVRKGKFGYIDCGFARMDGDARINARMTVRAGRIVFDPDGISMVEWEKAKAQYFVRPTGSDQPLASAATSPIYGSK